MNLTSTESLWREFQQRLHLYVRARVANDQVANDILQRAFLRMHKSIDAGTAPEQPQAWVFSITRNAIADHYREESAEQRRRTNAANLPPEDRAEHIATDTGVAAELARCMEPMLLGLEQPYREALRMTSLEGMTQGAAAKKAGISLSGMKSRVQRGRAKLRDLFETCCTIEVDARGKPIASRLAAGCPPARDGAPSARDGGPPPPDSSGEGQ